MKSLRAFSGFVLLTTVMMISACQKAGLGGEATIVAFPQRDTKPIPNAIMYIKYGTTSFPGTDVSVYDDSKVAIADMGEPPHVHFENLRKGDYYIYGVGLDSSSNQQITGGISVTLKNKAGETDVEVPLSE